MSSLFTVVTVVVFIYLILCVVKGPRVVVIEVVGEELVSYTSILMTTFVFMTIPVTASVFITTSVVKKNQKQKKKRKKKECKPSGSADLNLLLASHAIKPNVLTDFGTQLIQILSGVQRLAQSICMHTFMDTFSGFVSLRECLA